MPRTSKKSDTLAARIKRHRVANRLTQEDLARSAGVGTSTVVKAEGGKLISRGSLALIAGVFGVHVDELISGKAAVRD